MRSEPRKENADSRINLYLPAQLKDEIRAAADNDGRSINNWLRWTVEQRLQEEKAA